VPAYVIADVEVHDPDAYAAYVAGVGATVDAHGGRFLVRGGGPEGLEGGWDPSRIVVLEFPDRATARRWIESDAYAPLRARRQAASTGRLVLVDGPDG
jgi:uncharacterized protein (DUF1330 family)